VLGALLLAQPAHAAVLPDDRAEALYHAYEGGGVEINGPSILVRKKFAEQVSVAANYYVDMVSSASIDVKATASPYKEERTETSLSATYLRGKMLFDLAYSQSDENDYRARSAHIDISQDVFGDLTTISMGFSRGWDEVSKNGDPAFAARSVDRWHYRLGLTQILSKSLLANLSFETITDEGYLGNPYRSVRYADGAGGYLYQPELYPRTRTSNAIALRALYYLPYRAALRMEYRYFTDTWGIDAHSGELGYVHPLKNDWTLEFKYRYYAQNRADFYSDLFPYADAQNFLARDKELSSFASHTFGVGASYEFKRGWGFIDRSSISLQVDHIRFGYDDFRNVTAGGVVGEEPLYAFSANVIKLFLSAWY
jgi:hypothetical protein